MSGIVPEFYAGQRIRYRYPYVMRGEVLVPPNSAGVAFPEDQFRHGIDQPFEVHRMIPDVTPLDDQDPGEILDGVDASVLQKRIRLSVLDESKNVRFTKSPTLIEQLIKQNERTWEWNIPYTIILQEGFQVTCSSIAYPTVCSPDANCDLVQTQIGNARVEVSFVGYLLTLQPPATGRLSPEEAANLQGYMNYPQQPA